MSIYVNDLEYTIYAPFFYLTVVASVTWRLLINKMYLKNIL